jgi:polyisoprenyl-teichoic acid--peptidoglycan teichoic acid transferase
MPSRIDCSVWRAAYVRTRCLHRLTKRRCRTPRCPACCEAELALDVDLDPQALAVEAVLVALVLAEHGVEALVEVLVRTAPGVVDAHRVVGRDGPVEEAPARPARVLRAQPGEGAAASWARLTEWPVRKARGSGAGLPGDGLRVSYPAMQSPQGARARHRSPFAAAFLSLLFPGLGHVYAGAFMRGLAFAAVPVLLTALLGGVVLRIDRLELAGVFLQPDVLRLLLVINLALLVYRVVATVDAWRVAQFLNEIDASGTGRLGRAKLPIRPIAVAGLAAVVLVLGAGHLAIARFNVLALSSLDCVFDDEGRPECEIQDPDASPGASGDPTGSPSADPSPGPSDVESPVGTPDATTPVATLPPWDGTERLNILLIGSDQRPQEGTYNTDTLIVVSIDPETGQVALLQLPRDTVDVPVPAGPARAVWGSSYRGKINSWYTQNRNREDLWPGTDRTRGYNALKGILGELYDLDIRWFVEVNFEGFRQVVDTLGGVQINVQIPVSDDRFPGEDGRLRRVYIPSGPQHMTGDEALEYARSRHTSSDFDRGRRQQRVLLSLKEQADIGAVIGNLAPLLETLGRSVKTDIPPDQVSRLLGLADGIDVRNVRSYVFAPSFFAREVRNDPGRGYVIIPNLDRIRAAVRNAFTADPELDARRERLGEEAARVWVLNQSGRNGAASTLAAYLAFNGLDASAPNQRPEGTITPTRIVVYNGAETRLPQTIAYLEEAFGVTVQLAADTGVAVDLIVTVGTSTPDLQVQAPG